MNMALSLKFATIIYVIQMVVITRAYRTTPKGISMYSSSSDSTNQIKLKSGESYFLKCGLLDDHSNELPSLISSSRISWYFKKQQSSFVGLSYSDSSSSSTSSSSNSFDKISNNSTMQSNNDWNLIDCDRAIEESCITLNLTNVDAEKDSGEYKCAIQPFCSNNCNPKTYKGVQFVISYNVLVTPDLTQEPPKILDGLTNKTATLSSSAIFHCRVHSVSPPSIEWLRRSSNPDSHGIKYNNYTYEHLESSGARAIGENIYMSKLILTNIAFQDAGFYDCLAFTYYGFQKQEVYLSVVYPEKYLTYHRSEGIGSLIWLVLIPLCFISVPFGFWMFFYFQRNKKKKSLDVSMKTVTTNSYTIVNLNVV